MQYAVCLIDLDGNRAAHYFNNNTCIHTQTGLSGQWFVVDLQSTYIITKVSITNRGDGKF